MLNRPFLVLLVGIVLCCTVSITANVAMEDLFIAQSSAITSQDLIGMNFITPVEGELLSGNVTVKVNATLIQGVDLLLRWNNDSWVNITEWYNSTSQFFEYTLDVTCLPAGNVTFEAKQETGHGTMYTSVEATLEWYRPRILIVCDYYDTNITDYYTHALELLGNEENSGYSTWHTTTNGSPTASDLLEYQFVVWFTGDDSNPLSSGERNAIQTYLVDVSRRKMLLTGTEIAWRAYQSGYEAWLSSNFGVNDYIGDGSNSENVLGSVGTPYFGTNYSYGGGDGSQMGGGADWLRTMEASIGLFEFESSSFDEYTATQSPYVEGVFFGFAFDSISDSADRVDLMNRTLNYLGTNNPPLANILSPSEGELQSSPLSLSWESTSDIIPSIYNPIYTIFVDGRLIVDDWVLETYLLTTSDGNHTIRIVCEDNYGQRGYDSVSVDIDGTEPRNEITNYPESSILKSGSLLIFNITDVHLDIVVSGWDSESWTTFSSPYETYLPSGDGVHTFHVNSTDIVGNSNYTQFTLICDDTPPEISLMNQVNGSSLVSDTNISLEITDTYLNIVSYHWDLEDDLSFESEFETSLPSSEGSHDLYVNATDIAGNQRLAHFQFSTDNIAPTISLLNISNLAVLQTGTQMNFDIVDLHFASVGWSWDSAATVYYDVATFALFAPAGEGEHWLIVNATDKAGNSHSESYQFVIDNTAPEIVLSSPDEGASIIGGTSITVDVLDSHLVSVYFRWDLAGWDEWSTPYVTSAPSVDGYHSLFVNATDEAGNWIQVVFVFHVNGGIITTTSPTTGNPPVDLPTSLGLLGIGIGVGIGVSFLILHLLTRRKLKGSSAS